MGAGSAAAAWRRFTLTISGTNILVGDSGSSVTPASTTALAAAGTQTLPLFTLEGGGMILACKIKHSLAFTGGAVTATTIEVGRAAGTDIYSPRFNIFQAAANTAVARMMTHCPVLRCAGVEGAAAPGACQALGLVVGDKVISLQGFSIDAGFTTAGMIAAAFNSYTPGVDFEAIVTVVDQLQQISAANLSTGAILATVERGGSLESDAAAGTVINALIRTTTANVSALTAGALEIFLLVVDAPQTALGLG